MLPGTIFWPYDAILVTTTKAVTRTRRPGSSIFNFISFSFQLDFTLHRRLIFCRTNLGQGHRISKLACPLIHSGFEKLIFEHVISRKPQLSRQEDLEMRSKPVPSAPCMRGLAEIPSYVPAIAVALI